jgi:hypothetical protein
LKLFFKSIFISVIVFLLVSIGSNLVVFAESSGSEIQYNTPKDPMYEAKNGVFKNETTYYDLDIVSPESINEEGFVDKFWNAVTGKLVEEGVNNTIQYAFFSMTRSMFQIDLLLTNIMIGILNFAYDVNIINTLIDSIQSTVVSMTGITNNVFGSSGLYGGFLGIIAVAVAIYTLYQFVVRKASISAFSGLLTSLISLTIALVFFSSYSEIIKGANTLSVETSKLVLSGNADMTVNNDGDINNLTLQEKMNDNIFNLMVHKPYLMLQYGTTNQTAIGDARILNLLKEKPFSQERMELALKEVTEHGNDTLIYPNTTKRMNFAGLMLITNAVSSIPIYLLAGALIIFQFWFLVIAIVAPFALLWSALPNQFGVLKRYFLELSIPLVLKMAVSIFALLIFGLTEVLQTINALSNGSTMGLFLTSLVQALILMTLFLLRKRIFSIFSKGSDLLSNARAEMDNAFVNPFKKGVQNVATVGGAVIGGTMAGPQGAMVGASIGNNVAGALTGSSDPGDVARNTAVSMLAVDRLKNKKLADNPKPRLQENYEIPKDVPNDSPPIQGDSNDLMADTEGLKLAYFLGDKGLTPSVIDKTYDAIDKHNIGQISNDEMDKQFNSIVEQTQQGKMDDDFASTFAKGISKTRKLKELESEQALIIGLTATTNSSTADTGMTKKYKLVKENGIDKSVNE